MRIIYKYHIHEDVVISLPRDAQIVHVESNRGLLTMWVLIQLGEPTVKRRFRVFATGQEIPDGLMYKGTACVGLFVWHVFEEL